LQAAMQYDRQVAILGRSMLNIADLARQLGYMKYPDGLLVTADEVNSLPPQKVVILTTGSQGEPLSALSRIANNEHKQIKISPGDTVVISSTPIPGNERSVANTINALSIRGADVIYGRDAGVHVSGHGCQEEQKLMINLCRPKFFVPIHGEYRMLVKHTELAVQCGIPKENTFVMENGEVFRLTADSGAKDGRVPSGIILVDSSRAWEINEQIIAERRDIARDGLVTLTLSVSGDYSQIYSFSCNQKGLILLDNTAAEQVSNQLEVVVKSLLNKYRSRPSNQKVSCQVYLQAAVREFLAEKHKIEPLTQVVIHILDQKELPSSGEEGSIGGGLGKEEIQCKAD